MVDWLHSLGELGATLEEMYTSGKTLEDWSAVNVPKEDLLYKSGLGYQCRKIDAVTNLLADNESSAPKDRTTYTPVEARVVGSHRSKSVELPVTCLRLNYFNQVIAYAFIRDNFYDIKVSVISDSPIVIPYELIHYEWSEERLTKEKSDYLGYNPTDEGIRLMAEGSDEWYGKNWSRNRLLRKDGKIYCADSMFSCYCEGISKLGLPEDVFQPYQDDLKMFTCSLGSYTKVATVLEHMQHSLDRERYKRCLTWNERKRAESDEL